MMDFKKNLAELLKVKTLITLTVIGAITYGFLAQFVAVEVYVPIAMAIVTYYFQRKPNTTESGEG